MRKRIVSILRIFSDIKLLIIIFTLLVALYALFNNREIQVSFQGEGATVIMRGNEPSNAVVLLPANKLWLNTGLDIKPNQELKIAASGSVNFAIHRLSDSTRVHQPLDPGWLDADGDTSRRPRPIDELRKPFMIADAPYGVLVAGITPENKQLTKDNSKPDELIVVGKEKKFKSHNGGRLWLVVNEVLLNDEAESVYVATQEILDESYPPAGSVTVSKKKEEWEAIKKKRYYEAFFDDNIGEFLVQIEFLK